MNKVRTQLMLCGGTGCHASGTRDFKTALQKELDQQGLAEEIKIFLAAKVESLFQMQLEDGRYRRILKGHESLL